MLLTEWNWDDAKEVWQEEAREEGEKRADVKWQSVVADKDAVIADKESVIANNKAEIARLQELLAGMK